MSTEWYRGRYFSISPVLFVGAQASRVSVYLSAFCLPFGFYYSLVHRSAEFLFTFRLSVYLSAFTIRWYTGQPSLCLPFGFYFSLGCFH